MRRWAFSFAIVAVATTGCGSRETAIVDDGGTGLDPGALRDGGPAPLDASMHDDSSSSLADAGSTDAGFVDAGSGAPCDPASFVPGCDGTDRFVVCHDGHVVTGRCSSPNPLCHGGGCVAALECDGSVPPCVGSFALLCTSGSDGPIALYAMCPAETECLASEVLGGEGECVSTIPCGDHEPGEKWCETGTELRRCEGHGAMRYPCATGETCRESPIAGLAGCAPAGAPTCDPRVSVGACTTDDSAADLCDVNTGTVRHVECEPPMVCCIEDGLGNACCVPGSDGSS